MEWLILLLLCVVAVLVLSVAFCHVGIKVIYDADGLRVALFAGWIKFRLYPEFDGKKLVSLVPKKEKITDTKKKDQQGAKPTPGGAYETFISYVRFVAEILSDFKKKLVIKELELKLTLASEDPFNLALGYGAAWTAASNLTALMERAFTVKKQNVAVNHDFLGNQLRLLARLHISIPLRHLGLLGIKHLIRYFTKVKKISTTKKDGATK